MLQWIKENIGTIITALVLIALAAGAIWHMIRRKRQGKGGCGCGCSGCASAGSCPQNRDK